MKFVEIGTPSRRTLRQSIPPNQFKAALAAQRPVFGFWASLAHPVIAEIVALYEMDWVLFDMEHALNDPASLLRQLQAIKGTGLQPVVRLPGNDAASMKQVLDLGVDTVIVPMTETADDAAAAVRLAHYPPVGSRGVSGTLRAANYGSAAKDYFLQSAQQTCVICQIESIAAASRLTDITSVPGVDALMVGPRDLAASMGQIGSPQHDDVQRVIEQIASDGSRAGIPCGIVASNPTAARRYLRMGYRFFTVAGDISLLRSALERIEGEVEALRAEVLLP